MTCAGSCVLFISGFARQWIFESIPEQMRGVVTCALLPIERNRLISHHPGSFGSWRDEPSLQGGLTQLGDVVPT